MSFTEFFHSAYQYLLSIPGWGIIVQIIVALSPVILMFILLLIFVDVWVEYVRAKFFFKESYAVVEVKLPKETMKSPLAMELFLAALHQTGGEANWYDKYWLGKTRAWFSLEMVSVEGQIHFFIWMRKSSVNFISAALYAQFPGIEVHQSEDYAQTVHFDEKTMSLWAGELKFVKDDAYPIKTYVDYGLDKDPKEEFKVDPIAPLIEFLGTIGANQEAWIQVIVRAYKSDDHTKPGHLWKSHDKWRDGAKKIINEEIHLRDEKTKTPKKPDDDSPAKQPKLTKGEEEIVTSIERNIAKLGYDVGIRFMYFGKKENFNGSNIPGLIGCWKQFGHEHMNGFKLNTGIWHAITFYPWQDRKNKVRDYFSKQALSMYKRRSFFYHPYKHIPGHSKPMIMSSESLATIYHFPGQVVATPSFQRVPSKKSEAPANLPI